MELSAHGWRVRLDPETGGALTSARFDGRLVLGPVRPDQPPPPAHFPLVPFANRIALGLLPWAGGVHTLQPPPAGGAHALHGVGWTRRWQLSATVPDRVTMALDHPGDAGWPFAFRAAHRVRTGPGGLLVMSLAMRAMERQPVSLGLHPAFPDTSARPAHVTLAAAGALTHGADLIPDGGHDPAPAALLAAGTGLEPLRGVDACLHGWNGRARIDWPDLRVSLAARMLVGGAPGRCRHLHLYAPRGGTGFCLEPVSAPPNVHVRLLPGQPGPVVLEAGQVLGLVLRLSATPRIPG